MTTEDRRAEIQAIVERFESGRPRIMTDAEIETLREAARQLSALDMATQLHGRT